VLDTLDAAAVRGWAHAAADSLQQHRHEIDSINVYPIADADTGTNLAVTMAAARDALATAAADRSADDAATSLRAMARGAALAARGNSGVIMAELLRGLADGLAGHADCDGQLLRTALESASAAAYASVGHPVEGTILSVVRAAADGVAGLPTATPLAEVVRCARDQALDALANTPRQLTALAEAGVVDAGGRGLVVVLDSLAMIVTGDPTALTAAEATRVPRDAHDGNAHDRNAHDRNAHDRNAHDRNAHDRSAPEPAGSIYAYEVQYLLEAPAASLDPLRAALVALGDSLTIADAGDQVWNVHIHVDDAGAAIEAGVRAGRPHQISITRFSDQIGRPVPVDLVVVLRAAGLRDLIEEAGGRAVVVAGGTGTEVADVLAGLAAGSRCVLLSTDADLVPVTAEIAAAARERRIEVAVVPCRSPMQVLAALAVHDPGRRPEDDVIAMAEAAAAMRFARVEIAAGPGLTTIGACRAGDVLGLVEGDVVEIGAAEIDVTGALLDRLLAVGGELLTVVVRGDDPAIEGAIRTAVGTKAPFVELVIYPDQHLDCVALLGME
jgi:hypothetical protein